MTASVEKKPPRRHDLDALRAFAMLLGIGLHGALSFIAAPWVVQDRFHAPGLGLLVQAVHGFRMPLFFVMSGFFTAMLWRRRGLAGLIGHRARRILLPLLLGCVTIVPLMWGIVIWAKGQSSTYAPDASGRDVWTAAAFGNREAVVRFVADGVDLDQPEPVTGHTPLAWAVLGDHPDVVALLLAEGADPNARYVDENTALHTAAFFGRVACARLLLEAGADVHGKNVHGRTPLDSTRGDRRTTEQIFALLRVPFEFGAVEAGRAEIRSLLEERGARAGEGAEDDQTGKDVWTAAAYGNVSALARFAESGIDLDEADPLGRTSPLAWAVIGDQPQAVSFLLASGADVNARFGDRNTAMHTAAFFGRAECARHLIEARADLEAKNASGETPLDSSRHDRMTTEYIASLLRVPIEFGAVEEGRARIRAMIRSGGREEGVGPEDERPRAAGDALRSPADVLARARATPMLFPFFHHLWFLYFLCWLLLGFTLAVGVVRLLRIPALPAWATRSPLAWLWVVPVTLVPQMGMHLGGALPGFGPDTSAGLLPMPHVLLYYGVFFGFGALYFDAKDDDGKLGRAWWLLLPVALLVVFPLGLGYAHRAPWALAGGEGLRRVLSALLQVLYAWLMVFGLMGLFRRLLTRERPRVRYVSDASYWLYLIHLPLVVVAQAFVRDWGVAAWGKFLLLLAVVTALLLVTYRYLVRYTWVGRLLNGPRTRPVDR